MNDNENKTNAPTIKLLPCPICNGDAHIFWDVDTDEPDAITWHRAECRIKRCVSTSNFTTPEQAAEIWNTRNEADALRAEVEGLRMLLLDLASETSKHVCLDDCAFSDEGNCLTHGWHGGDNICFDRPLIDLIAKSQQWPGLVKIDEKNEPHN